MNKGKLLVVGIGPGSVEHMTKRAYDAILESDCIIGYKTYINLISHLITSQQIVAAMKTNETIVKPYASIVAQHGVLYRPKSVHLGIGCNRGTSAKEIKQVILDTLHEQQISVTSVKRMATIDLKKDEEGLLKVSEEFGWELIYYAPDELNKMALKNRSEVVYKYTGAYGVSEPAAMLSANTKELVLEKKKSGNVTISIAVSRGERCAM